MDDWVLLKLQPYRRVSLAARANKKLSPLFFGPFKVLECVGKVAYKLELPESAKMHPVFHISYFKPFRGNHKGSPTLPPLQHEDLHPLPQAILDTRLSKGQTWVLVHWQALSPAEASWEDASAFTGQYPSFIFADKHISQVVGNVTAQQDSKTKILLLNPLYGNYPFHLSASIAQFFGNSFYEAAIIIDGIGLVWCLF